jgi:hypothetical protein
MLLHERKFVVVNMHGLEKSAEKLFDEQAVFELPQ